MRRALGLVLAAMLLAGCAASAQTDDAARWPTPAELRQDLADDGWGWAADGSGWQGGRGHQVVYMGFGSPLWLFVHDATWRGIGLLDWPGQASMGYTAFMELAERLPITDDTVRVIARQVVEDGCMDYPVSGGMVTVRAAGDDVTIRVVEGGESWCDRELPPEASPGTSPAA